MSTNTPKKTSRKRDDLSSRIHNAPDFKSIYVNYTQTAASPTDISVGVGETSPTYNGVVEAEMKARLVFSPLQAKITVAMLIQVIRQYEKAYGKIAVPDTVAAQLIATRELDKVEKLAEGD